MKDQRQAWIIQCPLANPFISGPQSGGLPPACAHRILRAASELGHKRCYRRLLCYFRLVRSHSRSGHASIQQCLPPAAII